MSPSESGFSLRPYQRQALEAITRGFNEYQRQLVVKPTGCHAPGHPILMADGRIKRVEDIIVGDLVAGPDSMPRTVLELHRGRDAMFRIVPVKGDPFVVNGGHILRLRRTRTGKPADDAKPRFTEISIRDYCLQGPTFRHIHKLYRTLVDFPEPRCRPWHIEPYILGVILGDGSLHVGNVSVCTPDPEIAAELHAYAARIESDVRVEAIRGNKASNYHFKGQPGFRGKEHLIYCVRREGINVRCEHKFVPHHYKTADRRSRMELLAGLLDTDGFLCNGGYEYSSKSLQLAQDVIFIARSLGLAAYRAEKMVEGQLYQRVSISGDCSILPLRITRKRAPVRRQIKDVLVTGFHVEPAGKGDYFGFSLDRDQLYLDGNFTVHHNSGKTILFASLARHYQPRRTLVLAHREELIDQAVSKIRLATGLEAEVEMGQREASPDAPVVVASVQTLMRAQRRARWPRDHFGLVVIDECHHCLAESYQSILRHFEENAFVLGVSATPERSDKRQLGKYFQNIAYEVTLLDLIRQNWLAPIRVQTLPLQINLRGCRTTAGDYNDADLGHAIEPCLEAIADRLTEYRDRKTLVFLPLIRLSEQFAKLCRERGIAAEHVDGTSPNRREILERFRSGQTRLLSNAMLLTEGYDEPSIDCVVCLRPTKVRALFSQIVGRGTRLSPGKDHLLLLDFLWLAAEHSLIRPASLIASDAQEAAAISEALVAGSGDLEEAKARVDADRAARLAERLRENSRRSSRTFDALEFALSINDVDLGEFEGTMQWHEAPISPKQHQLLAQYGIDPRSVRNKGHASAIIDRVFTRMRLGLASAKQVRWLRKLGHPNPELASFEEAREFLSARFGAAA